MQVSDVDRHSEPAPCALTEREGFVRALAERDVILQATAFAADRFLRCQSWHDAVDDVLARLGIASRADRVYVFEKHESDDGTPVISQRFEWAAPGVDPQIGNPDLQEVPHLESGLRRWEEVLSTDGIIYGRVAHFPDDAERELLLSQGIVSIVVVPIFTQSRWWGFVGFDDCREGRDWTETEVEALRVAAGTLGAAIQRQTYEQELIAARDLAEEASRLKSALLTNMSHEIRTPINGIVGMGQLMIDELRGEARENMQMIVGSAERLLDTLHSILDLARLQSGTFPIVPVEVDPVELIERVVRRVRSSTESKGLELSIDTQRSPRVVGMDGHAFVRIAEHLLSNCVKFTESGSIDVVLEGDADSLRLTVRDTGIGMKAEFLPFVFDEFRQASSGAARTHEGSGIGLAVVRRLVERMGGRVAVASRPGEGSTFSVVIPVRGPAASIV